MKVFIEIKKKRNLSVKKDSFLMFALKFP